MKLDWKKLLVCLAIPLAVGGLAALLTGGGMGEYAQFVQPPLSPPGWLFPVVWAILYLLMGYASYRVLISGAPKEDICRALIFYGAQLFLNFLWPLIFFGLGWYWVALVVLLALWILVFFTVRTFGRVDEKAADLLLPYILWLTFAAYLNFGVALLN